MLNQKLVFRSFFYILNECYQALRNPRSLRTGYTATYSLLELKTLSTTKIFEEETKN